MNDNTSGSGSDKQHGHSDRTVENQVVRSVILQAEISKQVSNAVNDELSSSSLMSEQQQLERLGHK